MKPRLNSDYVVRRLKELSMSRVELATNSDLDPVCITRVVNGQVKGCGNAETVYKLSKALGCRMEDLIVEK